jgi:hypothetical protein
LGTKIIRKDGKHREEINCVRNLDGKNEKRFWELQHKWECNIGRDLRDQVWEVVNRMHCLHDKGK